MNSDSKNNKLLNPKAIKPVGNSNKNHQHRRRKHVNPLSKNKALYMMARCNKDMSELDRKQILFHELETFDDEVKSKNVHTQCKANIFRFANIISSFIVIVAGAVIVGLQATSPCISVPCLVLAGLLTVMQALYEVFRWGPQGVFFKQSTIRLKRIRRSINDIKLMIHQYTTDQLMSEIRYMRNEFDDIDFSTYKMTTGGDAKFKTNALEVTNDTDQIQLEPLSNPGSPTYHTSSPMIHPHYNNSQQVSPYQNNPQSPRSPHQSNHHHRVSSYDNSNYKNTHRQDQSTQNLNDNHNNNQSYIILLRLY